MTQEISSLMDGELEAQEAERAIRTCCAAEDQKATWFLYHAIGDAMRGHAPRDLARPARVIEALQTQPTVLAPKPRVAATALARVAIAAAASVATVAVVAWIGVQGGAQDRGEAIVAKSASSIQPVANKTTLPRVPVVDEQAYLTAHRQLPSPELYRPVNNRAATPAR